MAKHKDGSQYISEKQAKAKSLYDQRKQNKYDGVKTRQEERVNRSPQEQLKRLDQLLGENVGATKERARLSKLMEKTNGKASDTKSPEEVSGTQVSEASGG